MLRKRQPNSVPTAFTPLGRPNLRIARRGPITALLRRVRSLSSEQAGVMAVLLVSTATLIGFWLRTLRLDFQPLWFDEGYSLYFANSDFLGTAALTAADIHPPLYYYLLKIWMSLAGPSDLSVRLLSVFLGTLSIPLIYALGRRLFDHRLGAWGALLLSVSPLHVYYSQEVRMYALITLLTLVSTWTFACIVCGATATPSPYGRLDRRASRLWLVYVAAGSLSLYTQYFAVFAPLAHFAFLLWQRSPVRLWRRWLLAQVAVFITFLPWAAYAGFQLTTYVGGKVSYEGYSPLGLFDFYLRLLTAFAAGTERPEVWQWAAVPLVLLAATGILGWPRSSSQVAASDAADRGRMAYLGTEVVGAGLRPAPTIDGKAARDTEDGKLDRQYAVGISESPGPSLGAFRNGVLLCFFVILISSLGGWLVNQFLPFNPPRWERLYLFGAPFFALLVAMGIGRLGRRRPAMAWLGLSLCLLISVLPLYVFYTTERYPDEDYRPLVKTVSASGRPSDLLVAVYPWQIGYFQSYLRGPWPQFILMSGDQWNDPAYRDSRLEALGHSHGRVWVAAYQALGGIFESQVETYMAGHFFPALNDWHGNTRLLLFHASGDLTITERAADFDGWVKLISYGLWAKTVAAAQDSVDVALSWQAQKQLPGKLVVKLRLYDEAGHTWAQRDSAPAAGLRPSETWTTRDPVEDRHGLLIPAGTPPGEYYLGLSLTLNGNSLNIVEADGNPRGQELPLAKVQITKPSFAPRLESLPIRTRLNRPMGDGVEMAGYSMGNAAKPGETLTANVFWLAKQAPATDHQAVFKLVDQNGKVAGEQRQPVGQSYPARQWSAGEAIRDQYDLMIPASAANGVYELRLSLDDSTTYVKLDSVRVEGREHSFTPPNTPYKEASQFGDSIYLAGFSIAGHVQPSNDGSVLGRIKAGDSLTLKPVWRVEKEVGRNLKVFSHIADAGSRIWGQRDSIPGDGTAPTSGWIEGEYIEDSYEIVLKPDTPAGEVEVLVGFYNPLTGERLPAYDASGQTLGDKAILGRLEVWR